MQLFKTPQVAMLFSNAGSRHVEILLIKRGSQPVGLDLGSFASVRSLSIKQLKAIKLIKPSSIYEDIYIYYIIIINYMY